MAKFVSVNLLCVLLVGFTCAWKREFMRMPKSNEIGMATDDESHENAKNGLKTQAELIAAMMPKRKSKK